MSASLATQRVAAALPSPAGEVPGADPVAPTRAAPDAREPALRLAAERLISLPAVAGPLSSPRPVSNTDRPLAGTERFAAGLARAGLTVRQLPSGGLWARGPIAGYPQPVSIFIPAGFRPRDAVPVALHLHGFTLGRDVLSEVYGRFDFDAMMRESGFRGITVVPESRDRVATYNESLSSASQVDRLLRGVTGVLRGAGAMRGSAAQPQDGVERIVLSGHSGAYLPIARLAGQSSPFLDKIEGVGLFDATYSMGNVSRHARLARQVLGRGGLLYVAHIKGSATAPAARALRDHVQGAWQRELVDQPSEAPARGAVFVTERADGALEQHWRLFRRRYVELLRAFAD